MPRKVLSKLSFISTYSTADQDKQPPLSNTNIPFIFWIQNKALVDPILNVEDEMYFVGVALLFLDQVGQPYVLLFTKHQSFLRNNISFGISFGTTEARKTCSHPTEIFLEVR